MTFHWSCKAHPLRRLRALLMPFQAFRQTRSQRSSNQTPCLMHSRPPQSWAFCLAVSDLEAAFTISTKDNFGAVFFVFPAMVRVLERELK